MKARTERRQFGRRQTGGISAWIIVRGRPKLPARIVNNSPNGALLEVERPPWLPFCFELQISGVENLVWCELRHVTKHGVGVVFRANDNASRKPNGDMRALGFDEWMGPVASVLGGGD